MGGGIEIGATECCMIMYGLQFLCAILPGTNSIMGEEIDIQKLVGPSAPNWTFYVGDLVAANTFILSVQYNFGNFKAGFNGCENKLHAVSCMLPFFYVWAIMLLASNYSQFWHQYPSVFVFGVGIMLTNMTGNLNLKSCVLVKYNPIYIDPFIFCGILYMDYNRIVEP